MKTKRIALIIPHTDITLETDLQRELPPNYIIHTHRIWLEEVGEEAEKKMVDEELPKALKYLKGITDFDYVVFGCTSASAVYGKNGLERLEKLISDEIGCKGISAFGAVLYQLKKKEIKNISLLSPYTPSVNEFMKNSFKDFGIDISFYTGLGLKEDIEISKVDKETILKLIKDNKESIIEKSDGLLISCTNFKGVEVYREGRKLLGIETITSNQSIIDWILEK